MNLSLSFNFNSKLIKKKLSFARFTLDFEKVRFNSKLKYFQRTREFRLNEFKFTQHWQWATADGLGCTPMGDLETCYQNFDPTWRGLLSRFGSSTTHPWSQAFDGDKLTRISRRHTLGLFGVYSSGMSLTSTDHWVLLKNFCVVMGTEFSDGRQLLF